VRQRSKGRAWALRVLYAWESRGPDSDLVAILEEFLTQRRIAPERRAYMRRLIEAIEEQADAIDRALEEALTNWRFDRISAIDRNILRIAAVEMLRFEDVPPRVSIQEALRLAERYGTDQSPRFVNGVLDGLMRRLGRE
jgi:N utilization substance protein B